MKQAGEGKGKRQTKYPAGVIELAQYLYSNTPIPRSEVSRLMGVPEATIKGWWKKVPCPPHRGGPGTIPKDQVEVYRVRVADLEAEVEALRSKIPADQVEAESSVDQLIRDLKAHLGKTVSIMKPEAIATSIRALIEVRNIEQEQSGENAPKIVYYMPESAEKVLRELRQVVDDASVAAGIIDQALGENADKKKAAES
jgi:hypothetical protein